MKSEQASFGFPAVPPKGIDWLRERTACRANYAMTEDGVATGWWVRDCGHPTALRPYYVVTPGGKILLRKFRLLVDAKAAAIDGFTGKEET